MNRSRRLSAPLRSIACVLAFAWACAARAPKPVAPLPEPDIVALLPEGATLAMVRPTEGVAKLALWLRAGSRHADPPALATAAAFWAERATGARARVLPDATEFTLTCDTKRQGVPRCVAQLARAFALDAPSNDQTRALRERLRAARLRARAESSRQLSLESLTALFGEGAERLEPLGRDEQDVHITPAAIATFLRAHYATDRSVLMAAGDVSESELSRAFASVRKPSSSATSLPAALEAKTRARAFVSDVPGVAVTLAAPSMQSANELAAGARFLYPKAAIHAIPLRGLPLVQVRVSATDQPAKRAERLVYDLRRLAAELDGAKRGLRPDESLDGLLRELGEGWSARGTVAPQRDPWPVGLAIAFTEPLAPDAPEAQKRAEQRRLEVERALTTGLALAEGRVEGTFGEHLASVETAGGSQVMVQRRPGDRWFGAAVRLGGGSHEDPATRHGRAALLATLLADGCGHPWGFRLETTLSALDARIEPLVGAEGIGLSVTAPREHARAALDLMLRCALQPELSRRALEHARLRLLEQLARRPELRASAQLAQMLAPLAPGLVAPWGTPFGVAEVSLSELRRLHAQSLRGPSVAVWVAADAHPEELARFVGRRLSPLTRTGEPATLAEPGPVRVFGGELTDVESLRVMVGVRANASGGATLAAGVFAEALRLALSKRLGRTLWASGTSHGSGLESGVLIAITEAELPGLQGAVLESLAELRARPWPSWEAELAMLRAERVGQHSSALGWAQAAFFGALHEGEDMKPERAALEALGAATPGVWIMRPRP